MPTQSVTTDKPVVAILLTPQMRSQLIPPAAEKRLAEVATVIAPGEDELVQGNLARLLDGATVAITGWGTPRLDEALLAKATLLKLVAHAAGSIRHLVPFSEIENGRVRVTHSAVHIGEAVCEFVMAQIFNFLRHPAGLADGMRAKEPWFALRSQLLGRLLGDQPWGSPAPAISGACSSVSFRRSTRVSGSTIPTSGLKVQRISAWNWQTWTKS